MIWCASSPVLGCMSTGWEKIQTGAIERFQVLDGSGLFLEGSLGWSQTHRGTHQCQVQDMTTTNNVQRHKNCRFFNVFYWSGGFWSQKPRFLAFVFYGFSHDVTRFPCLLSSSAPVLGFRGLTFQWRLSHSKTVLVQSLTAKTAHTYMGMGQYL